MDNEPQLVPMHGDQSLHKAKIAQTGSMPNEQISGLNFANFNQDYSCISVGYENGFRIFNCDPFTQCYERIDGSIGIVEMLFCSSLLAIVGTGEQSSLSPRRLKIINTKRNTTICELTFPSSILAIRMNRERLIVLSEELIYIYDITNMRLLHTVEIPSNPTGLLSLSINVENNYLAYPSPQKISKLNNNMNSGLNPASIDVTGINGQHPNTSINSKLSSHDDLAGLNNGLHSTQSIRNGDVIIFDCKSLQPVTVIDAHKTHIAAMTFSHDGTLLATASDKGTIVRVFSVETGLKLYQFRRGTYNTKIFSLAFSPSNMFLIASSATGTVHIFRLGEEEAKNTTIKSKGSSGWLNSKKYANDRKIEMTRQGELDKLMKNRQAHIESIENYDDIPGVGIIQNKNNLKDGSLANNFNKLQIHSDSEDELDDSSDGDDIEVDDDENDEVGDVDIDVNDPEQIKREGNKNANDSNSNINTVAEVEEEEYENVDDLRPLRSDDTLSIPMSSLSQHQSGTTSILSSSSSSGGTPTKPQPIVDSNRRSVARMLRRTSQSLGRKAAEKMGTYLPPRFSSILEPNRHFASFKVPTNKENMTIVGVMETLVDSADEDISITSHFPAPHINHDDISSSHSITSTHSMPSVQSLHSVSSLHNGLTVHILVVSAEGMFYTYQLDTIRGGDCVLLSQRSLVE